MFICERCKNSHDGTFGTGRFCSRSCANKRVHSAETKSKIRQSVIITQTINPDCKPKQIRVSKICPICKLSFSLPPYDMTNRIYCSRKCFDYDSQHGHKFCKIPDPGPENKGGRNSKKGYYKGIWCDSTYELVWVIYNIDHNITFTRNTQGFKYQTPDGNLHTFYPDFKCKNYYAEMKNYLKDLDKYKIDQFPYTLKLYFRKDLNIHFEYVHNKYGKDLISLYDSK